MQKGTTSPNKIPTESPTDAQQWHPPPGVYFEYNKQRPSKPFLLRWTDGGTKRTQSFESAVEREDAARNLAEKRADHGKEILNFDPREWRRWLDFKARIGDVDPFDVLREWEVARGASGVPHGNIRIPEAVETYIAFRAEGQISADTKRHFAMHLRRRFAATHAALKLRDLTPKHIGDWLKSLVHPRTGEPMDAVTRRHHRKDVNTFLGYCVAQGWIVRNPCDLVAVPHVEEKDVELMTVAEGRALFAANAGHRIVGRLALEAFGFLRASRAGTIPRDHINFGARGLLLRGAGRKGSKARFRQGHPDNLWAWLNRAPDECWAMEWWEYRNQKRDAFVRAGIAGGSENRLRKTCLSAHLAWLKNQPLTSYLAQHRHQSTTDIYLGVMDEKDGAAWFQIGPPFA